MYRTSKSMSIRKLSDVTGIIASMLSQIEHEQAPEGTLSLIVSEHTQIFTVLAYPVTFILKLLQIPSAAEAAPAVVVGFADMFLPAVLVANVEFEMTRFVIGVLSFTQLIYMTETGIIILKSDIPLGLKELAIIFIERILITLPIITVIAHIIF